MLNKRQIVSAFNAGKLEEVAKECQRYGHIESTHDWAQDSGTYAGAWRKQVITHHGIMWEVRKHNGEVISVKRNHTKGNI